MTSLKLLAANHAWTRVTRPCVTGHARRARLMRDERQLRIFDEAQRASSGAPHRRLPVALRLTAPLRMAESASPYRLASRAPPTPICSLAPTLYSLSFASPFLSTSHFATFRRLIYSLVLPPLTAASRSRAASRARRRGPPVHNSGHGLSLSNAATRLLLLQFIYDWPDEKRDDAPCNAAHSPTAIEPIAAETLQ